MHKFALVDDFELLMNGLVLVDCDEQFCCCCCCVITGGDEDDTLLCACFCCWCCFEADIDNLDCCLFAAALVEYRLTLDESFSSRLTSFLISRTISCGSA